MKRIAKFTILLILAVCLLLPAQGVFAADDEGYYIRDYHVEVVANPDRSYDVTETIDVWFDEYSHGIYRFIPTKSTVESYTLSGFRAEGDPFTIQYDGSLRIGDPDIEIIGQKTYTIKYTLEHYADTVPDADYFYMNLIGTEWDVRIESFSARVTLPDNALVEEYTLTGGEYGSTEGAELADVTVTGNIITVKGRETLPPGNGVTLNVRMPEGTFYAAEVWTPPIEIKSLGITVDIDKYGLITVVERYTAKVNKGKTFNRRIYDYHGGYNREAVPYRVTSISHTGPDGRLIHDAAYIDLYDYEGEIVNFSINYTLQSRFSESAYGAGFLFSFMDSYEELSVEKLSIEITGPFKITGFVYAGWKGEGILGAPSIDGNRLTAQSVEPFFSQDVDYIVKFEGAAFVRKLTLFDFALPALFIILALIVIYYACIRQKERPLVPVIEFYPPMGMSPAETGYVIDRGVSTRDVTSLIYYWASHGHLNIEIIDEKNFKLHKLTELDELHPEYEREMFGAMWGHGEDGIVSNDDLKDKFYSSVSSTANNVRKSFSGEREFFMKGRKPAAGTAIFIIVVVFIIMLVLANKYWYIVDDFSWIVGILFVLSLCTLGFISHFKNSRYKNRTSGNISLIVSFVLAALGMLVFAAAFGDGSLMLTLSAFLSGGALFAIVLSVPFLERRTDYYTYVLGLCLGFKTFLMTAEKDRIEMLLNQNPDYYYNILPYAQVLGVTKIWEKKFDGLLTQPPSWCYGAGAEASMFSARTMSNMMGTMQSSMTSSPSSSGDGGGGSFSGGGSSGGGSGGGGGGRW